MLLALIQVERGREGNDVSPAVGPLVLYSQGDVGKVVKSTEDKDDLYNLTVTSKTYHSAWQLVKIEEKRGHYYKNSNLHSMMQTE